MQILIQLLLHSFDRLIALMQVFLCLILVAGVEHYWVLLGLRHNETPLLVNRGEVGVDFWQLSLDVGRVEDRPKVAPATLGSGPFF